MRILVTGGAGFIGSNFVCHSLSQGHEIINIDKLTYAGNLENLGAYYSHKNHIFYKEDISNKQSIKEILFKEQPEVIFHMAAESHVDRSIDRADLFIKTNVLGTQQLLDASLKYFQSLTNKNNFRFFHLSTDEVFGTLGAIGKFNETMPYRPNSPYAASKAASDLLVRSYYKTYNLPIIIINSSNNYGPKQYPEKLIPLMILNALEQKPLPVYGKGQQIRDWMFITDHVEALLELMLVGKVGESYCISADNEMTNLNLVQLICETLDRICPVDDSYRNLITFVADRPGHDYRYAIDASKLIKAIRWSPKVTFQEGINRTVLWYLERFEYLRIKHKVRKRIGLRWKES